MTDWTDLVGGLGYVGTACIFCRKFLEGTRASMGAYLGCLLWGSLLLGGFRESLGLSYMAGIVLHHLLFWSMTALWFSGEPERKGMVVAIELVVWELMGNFCDSFFTCGALLLGSGEGLANGVPGPRLMEAICCATVAVNIGGSFILARMLEPVLSRKSRGWYGLASMPLFFMVLLMDLVNWGATRGILFQGRENWDLFHNQLFSHGAVCALTAFMMCAAGIYLYGMERMDREQKRNAWYQSQMLYYKMLEEQYGRLESLRHDMKNYMTGLTGLLKNREWEGMERYLEQVIRDGGLGGDEMVTGSRAVDALLVQKQNQAREQGVSFQCLVELPGDGSLEELDLCVLLGNALDNALEECARLPSEKELFIRVQARVVKRCFVLQVENSAHFPSGQDKGPWKKRAAGKPGLGLSSMRRTAEKYGGMINTEAGGDSFKLSALLPLKSTVQDIKPTV